MEHILQKTDCFDCRERLNQTVHLFIHVPIVLLSVEEEERRFLRNKDVLEAIYKPPFVPKLRVRSENINTIREGELKKGK